MIVHLASTNDIGLRAAVEAPARQPDGTWNIKLYRCCLPTLAGFTSNHCIGPGLRRRPAVCSPTPSPRRGIRPSYSGLLDSPELLRGEGTANSPPSTTKLSQKTGADGQDRTDDLRFTKPLLYQLSYIGQIASSLCHVCAAAQVNQSSTAVVTEGLRTMGRSSRSY